MHLHHFISVVLLLVSTAKQGYLAASTTPGCDRNTGPTGTVQCVTDRSTNMKPEWATCSTYQYIRRQSAGRHSCQNQTNGYCLYRCSVEASRFNKAIQDSCTCDPSRTKSMQNSSSIIPSWCYSPPGDTCSWYEQCLETVHPCKGHTADYAIRYAKRFCGMYDDSYNRFTQSGKKWVDSVRRCLQVALVPLIRPWQQQRTSCKTIQDIAFGSHTCCYTGGSACSLPGSPSICSLWPSDWWRVFWTVKSAFVLSTTSAAESLKGLLGTAMACGGRWVTGGTQNVAQVQLEMKSPQGSNAMFSAPQQQQQFMDQTALETGKAIAQKMNWIKNNIDWFAYAVKLPKPGTFSLRILITKKEKPNLLFASARRPTLKQTVANLFATVAKDGGKFDIGTPTKQKSAQPTIEAIEECGDMSCSTASLSSRVRSPSKGTTIADAPFKNLILLLLLSLLSAGLF